jgi:predicted negative regulator of RcsB-dependent stress response
MAAWNGWNYWQRSQAVKAAALFDEVEQAAQAKDTAKLELALAQMKDRFSGTALADQSALLAGKSLHEAGKADAARAALVWVSEQSSDPSYQAVARLRLAALDIEANAFDQALKTLEGSVPASFEPLVADRRGDIYMAQGKPDEARTQYETAWRAFSDRAEYRQLVGVKLAALGVDSATLAPVPAAAAEATK